MSLLKKIKKSLKCFYFLNKNVKHKRKKVSHRFKDCSKNKILNERDTSNKDLEHPKKLKLGKINKNYAERFLYFNHEASLANGKGITMDLNEIILGNKIKIGDIYLWISKLGIYKIATQNNKDYNQLKKPIKYELVDVNDEILKLWNLEFSYNLEDTEDIYNEYCDPQVKRDFKKLKRFMEKLNKEYQYMAFPPKEKNHIILFNILKEDYNGKGIYLPFSAIDIDDENNFKYKPFYFKIDKDLVVKISNFNGYIDDGNKINLQFEECSVIGFYKWLSNLTGIQVTENSLIPIMNNLQKKLPFDLTKLFNKIPEYQKDYKYMVISFDKELEGLYLFNLILDPIQKN